MKALDIDRRIIFIFVFLGVAIPLMVDFTLPIKPTPPVISAYDAFEKVAAEKPGSTILLSFSYGASTAPEMQPMARAVLRHCFRLGFKVVGICLWPDGVGLAEADCVGVSLIVVVGVALALSLTVALYGTVAVTDGVIDADDVGVSDSVILSVAESVGVGVSDKVSVRDGDEVAVIVSEAEAVGVSQQSHSSQ